METIQGEDCIGAHFFSRQGFRRAGLHKILTSSLPNSTVLYQSIISSITISVSLAVRIMIIMRSKYT